MADYKIPVILDTDIGGDIDDTWALALLLKMDQFDLKLISITGFDTYYQVQLTAKLLTAAGRTDIPIAYNLPQDCKRGPQDRWVGDFSLSSYPGEIYTGTLDPMKRVVEENSDKINILSIGGKTNLAELLRNCPDAVEKCVIYSMQGSFREKYRETNIRLDVQSARQMMAYDVEKYIVPTDVCGHTFFDGDLYQTLLKSKDPLVKAVMDNYLTWWEDCDWNERKQNPGLESSIMYDPITLMYMADEELFISKPFNMYIDFDGFSYLDTDEGNQVVCVTDMVDEGQLKKRMVEILIGNYNE